MASNKERQRAVRVSIPLHNKVAMAAAIKNVSMQTFVEGLLEKESQKVINGRGKKKRENIFIANEVLATDDTLCPHKYFDRLNCPECSNDICEECGGRRKAHYGTSLWCNPVFIGGPTTEGRVFRKKV